MGGFTINKTIECKATCNCDLSEHPDFILTDLYYSCQGNSSTCTRHAIAKGVQFILRFFL